MRKLLFVAAFLVAGSNGCTVANRGFCCVTEETCRRLGFDDGTQPCGTVEVCSDENRCIAVECTSNDQCSIDRPICDSETHSCRACSSDDQCASGVCIEVTGVCAVEEGIIYVADSGLDMGSCSKSLPCKTVGYAMFKVDGIRKVIRILDGFFNLGNTALSIHSSAIIDGSNTTLTAAVTPVVIAIGPGTLEGVRLEAETGDTTLLRVDAGGVLTMAQSTIDRARIQVNDAGVLRAVEVTMKDGELNCSGRGYLTVERSRFQQSLFDSTCELVLADSRFEAPPGSLVFPIMYFSGETQRIENNVFIGSTADTLLVQLTDSPGSSFRFNTIFNTSSTSANTPPIKCLGSGSGLEMSSNIVAYRNSTPSTCAYKYSLFDTISVREGERGAGNISAEVATFFRDPQAGDFHLSESSPALGLGEAGLVTSDLDGTPRPQPSGSKPDAGAFEAQR